jgi:glycine/serine hydroxymethyltransferase
MNASKEYQTQVIKNARAFARCLKAQGWTWRRPALGYTSTHRVILRVRKRTGEEVAKALETTAL